jgi:hypothetical protein
MRSLPALQSSQSLTRFSVADDGSNVAIPAPVPVTITPAFREVVARSGTDAVITADTSVTAGATVSRQPQAVKQAGGRAAGVDNGVRAGLQLGDVDPNLRPDGDVGEPDSMIADGTDGTVAESLVGSIPGIAANAGAVLAGRGVCVRLFV